MTSDLDILLADSFSGDLDPSTWTTDIATWPGGTVDAGNGTARLVATASSPPGPGVMAYCGFSSVGRQFTPHLSGTNLLEVTLTDCAYSGPFLNKHLTADGAASDREDPFSGNYLTGFCLAIGSYRGLVGTGPTSASVPVKGCADRVVQIYFDWYSKAGIWYLLNRNALSADWEQLRTWGSEEDKETWRRDDRIDCPVVTGPGNSVSLAWRRNPLGDDTGWGHRYGLLLEDDGNTLSWLLDGNLVDKVDISGFFSSSPGCVAEGAYATIVGGGSYQHNVWTIADLRISGTP